MKNIINDIIDTDISDRLTIILNLEKDLIRFKADLDYLLLTKHYGLEGRKIIEKITACEDKKEIKLLAEQIKNLNVSEKDPSFYDNVNVGDYMITIEGQFRRFNKINFEKVRQDGALSYFSDFIGENK